MGVSRHVVASICVLVASQLVGSNAHADNVAPAVAPVVAAPSDETVAAVDSAGSTIRRLGESVYPTVYAGVAVDEIAGVVLLQVTSLGDASQALVQAAGSVPVRPQLVTHSYSALWQLQSDVVADGPSWGAQGVTITNVGIDYAANKLVIGVPFYNEESAQLFYARYGTDLLIVREVQGGQSSADRFHDTSPYNGGDHLVDTLNRVCTAGFGIHLLSSPTTATGPYLITAGHCFSNTGTVSNNGVTIGTVARSGNIYKDYGDDVEVVYKLTSSKYIWETDTARATGANHEVATIGMSVCHSGIATNKRCGTVTAINQCPLNTDTSLHYCHQDFVSAGTGLLVAGGDSGGPWFTATGSGTSRTFNALGVQSLGLDTPYACTTSSGPSTTCHHQASYTEAEYAIAIDYNSYVNHP